MVMGHAAGLPRLNEPAPFFEARTTQGPRRLDEYCGRWLVLFSHPADFTPVCTSEFVAFARAYPEFQALDCDLLGLSVDSAFAHIAWLRDIEESFGVEIPFPVIEDASGVIAQRYGMIQPGESDTSAVRATFVIDPDGMLRAMIYYPMTTGRSVEEILRLVRALRVAADDDVVTPEGWRAGDPVLLPPPTTLEESAAAPRSGEERAAWYYRKSSSPAGPGDGKNEGERS